MLNSKPRVVFGLYGAGGFGREVMPLISKLNFTDMRLEEEIDLQIYFVETTPGREEVNGTKLISENAFFELESDFRYFNVAIGQPTIRREIAEKCMNRGASPISIYSPHSIVYPNNEIKEGIICCANSVITSNTQIGKFFHSNLSSYVAHDCVIGDYVTFAPNVQCNGNVQVEDGAYVGAGAIIKQGTINNPIVIGKGAIVGMGAVVTKNVEPFTTVVGNPAKPYKK
jgi:sugar O-acyltransferase (sialic acid O-acetyltransferase NeuD family)